jgi:hypothetical protein
LRYVRFPTPRHPLYAQQIRVSDVDGTSIVSSLDGHSSLSLASNGLFFRVQFPVQIDQQTVMEVLQRGTHIISPPRISPSRIFSSMLRCSSFYFLSFPFLLLMTRYPSRRTDCLSDVLHQSASSTDASSLSRIYTYQYITQHYSTSASYPKLWQYPLMMAQSAKGVYSI